MAVTADPGSLRIGEFARRVGVSPELLRAWENRYELLRPVRSPGGFRLYTDEDAERVARMRHALDSGLSAAEAARAALERDRPAEGLLPGARARLLAAIGSYDEAAVQSTLDESLEAFGLEAALRDLILPTLSQLGRDWDKDTLGIGREHFASNLIRGRLLSLARLWGRGGGPLALLACVPGEAHDISLLAFGLLLRSHGWRVLFLGANTPIQTFAQTAKATQPDIAVLTSFDPALLEAQATALRRLARTVALAFSGPGASDALCARIGVRRLDGDLVAAANAVAASH
jgi:MerR family transcriptional regulator, light-induced transcriptional regulator